jgi:protein O-mannosyl-transferase
VGQDDIKARFMIPRRKNNPAESPSSDSGDAEGPRTGLRAGQPQARPESHKKLSAIVRRFFSQDWFVGLVIVSITVVVYWPVLHAGFIWDDDSHVTRADLRTIRGLWRIWFEPGATQQYYPFLHSAFWIEYAAWKETAFAYHLTNVLLHGTVAWLLYNLLRRLSVSGALFAAFGFALHPVCAESVAWISEQKNTLSAVFYLASALAYIRFDRDRQVGSYALACVLFGCALATKTVTATLPAALLVILWFKQGRLSWKSNILPLVPFLGLGAAAGLVTALVERIYIGAKGAVFELSLAGRLLVSGRAVLFYLGKIFWPFHLTFIYRRWEIDDHAVGQYVYPAAVGVLLAAFYVIRGRTRGPLAAALLYVGTLFPALGFINVYPFIYSYVADHFQYLAAAVANAATAAAFESIPFSASLTRGARLAIATGAAFALIGLAYLTRQKCLQYSDNETLWGATLAENPDCGIALGNLAAILEKEGHFDQAIAKYKAVLKLKQFGATAEAHYNLACALVAEPGRSDEAIAEFEEALKMRPDYAEAQDGLGTVLAGRPGCSVSAIEHFQEALRISPNFARAHYNIGTVFSRIGRIPDAIREFEAALRIQPNNSEACTNLGNILCATGKMDEGIGLLEEAVRINPSQAKAHFDLGNALVRSGRNGDAIEQYKEALLIQPNLVEADNNLGIILCRLGRTSEGIEHIMSAIRTEPNFPRAHFSLGTVLLQTGRRVEAAAEFEKVLQLEPNEPSATRMLEAIKGGH